MRIILGWKITFAFNSEICIDGATIEHADSNGLFFSSHISYLKNCESLAPVNRKGS